jgi:hypothetical protein
LEVAFADVSAVAGYDSFCCWHYVFAGIPAAAAFLAGTIAFLLLLVSLLLVACLLMTFFFSASLLA